jgi:hypothetical protein
MKIKLFGTFALTALLISGCDSKIEDLESIRPTSNIPVTESNGVVTGTVSSTATTDQRIVASASSKVADASVTFPPGALAVSTEISVGVATDKSAGILAELGVTDALQSMDPLYVGPGTGTPPAVAAPLTIQLPLPLEDLEAGLHVHGDSKLALLYLVYNNGWKAGLIPLNHDNLIGAFMKQSMPGLGYFQIVYMNSAKGELDASSQITPELKGGDAQDD